MSSRSSKSSSSRASSYKSSTGSNGLASFFSMPSPQPSKSSSSAKSPKSSKQPKSSEPEKTSVKQIADREAKAIWKEVKERAGNSGTMILAVVNPEHKDQMKKLRSEEKDKKIGSEIIISTPNDLQTVINRKVNRGESGYNTLYLVVSSTIDSISYQISNFMKKVYVLVCGKLMVGHPDRLRIESNSTYCGIPSYAWDLRDAGKLRTGGYQLSHEEGCYFDTSDCDEEVQSFLGKQPMGSNMSENDMGRIKEKFGALQDDVSSAAAAASPSPATNETASWFGKWKALLASVIGAGAGFAGAGGAIWCSAAGIFVKGPFGLSLTAGYVNFAAIGGACVTGLCTGVAAAAAVYLVPWDKVFKYLKQKLVQIWEYICDVVKWVWEKIKEMASSVASWISGSSPSHAQKPVRLSL